MVILSTNSVGKNAAMTVTKKAIPATQYLLDVYGLQLPVTKFKRVSVLKEDVSRRYLKGAKTDYEATGRKRLAAIQKLTCSHCDAEFNTVRRCYELKLGYDCG
jgi:hypothetical protein